MRFNIKKLLLGGFALATLLYLFSQDFTFDDPRLRTAWSLPLAGKVFVLDPGHGGYDGGAVSKSGLIEKEVSLAITIYLRDLLQEAGALVFMTRETDTDLASEETERVKHRKRADLQSRIKIINESYADMMVSVHLNSMPSPRWRGAQVFYNPKEVANKQIATFIQDELIDNLENTTRRAKADQDIFILRHTEIPGVLVEVGFLSNAEEADLLSSESYQKKVAVSIYEGILRYVSGEKAPETD